MTHAAERATAYLRAIPPPSEGGRNGALNRAAFALLERFDLAEDVHRDLCLAWAARCEPPYAGSGAARTIKSAFDSAHARGAVGAKADSSGNGHRPADATPRPVAPAATAPSIPKTLWKSRAEAETRFGLLPFARDDEEARRIAGGYGLDPAYLPDGWRIFDYPKLGRGLIYRGEDAHGNAGFAYRSFERNGEGKREPRNVFGPPDAALYLDGDPDFLAIVAGQEKAVALGSLGATVLAQFGGERAPSAAWCERIARAGFQRIVACHDADEHGSKANTATCRALAAAGVPVERLALVEWPADARPGFDINDILREGGPDAVRDRLSNAAPWHPDAADAGQPLPEAPPDLADASDDVMKAPNAAPATPQPETVSAAALLAQTLPPIRWIVEGFRPEGLTLIAAKPKKGKSWLELGLAISIAGGTPALDRFPVSAGPVLYCALEDSPRRINARLQVLLAGRPAPAALDFAFTWPRLDRGGLGAFQNWITAHPGASSIVIDTFARVRPPKSKNGDAYQEDAAVTATLQRLAVDNHVSLALVHHCRKAAAEDAFDTVNGSMGLNASADCLAVLDRRAGAGTLLITGRDLEEQSLAMTFNSGLWTFAGFAEPEDDMTKLEKAKGILIETLALGPLPSDKVFALAKENGIGRDAMYGAKKALGKAIKCRKEGLDGPWIWRLLSDELPVNTEKE